MPAIWKAGPLPHSPVAWAHGDNTGTGLRSSTSSPGSEESLRAHGPTEAPVKEARWGTGSPDMERTRSRAPRHTCCPAWDSSLAGASLVCLTCTPGSELRTEGSTQSMTEVPGPRIATVKACWAGGGRHSHLNSGLPCSSPESKPSSDRVPVPTLVVTVTSLFPTSQVLVLPPARRNSPTGDL